MGTWYLGEGSATRCDQEIATLRAGIDHGLTVIDTAEMYGEGLAETLVGKAIAPYDRHDLVLISKFYPWHATARQLRKALEQTLARLGTDYLDMYLYHWRGNTPLKETLAGLNTLRQAGLIRAYGVSNFDVADLEATQAVADSAIAANEVLYNLQARGIEYNLQPYQKRHGQTLIGYSPFGSGQGDRIRLPRPLLALARAKGLSSHQLMLAWVLRHRDLLAIPKASTIAHMQDNLGALAVTFTPDELALIDQYFPAPTTKQPLTMI